jgi:hypothetical protein
VDEELLVNRQNEGLNVTCCDKRAGEGYESSCRSGPDVRRLTNLASRLILSLGVGVT